MFRALWRFLVGYRLWLKTGHTPQRAYFALRYLHARSNGYFNDLWRACAQRIRPFAPQAVDGFLGPWSVAEQAGIAAQLEQDGIALLPRRLPESLCRELEGYARSHPCLPLGQQQPTLYVSGQAQALRYDFDLNALLSQPLAARIAKDGTFAAVAGAYFRTQPVFDFLAMWWTTAAGPRDLSGAAQMFHYDMDRIFFLKFFVYLTDVGPDNGPHVYVAGSHRRKPKTLREDRRFEDGEIAQHYSADRVRSITGPRGTVFAADTRGLHKGEPVRQGERLVLQVEYALNRFGQNY